VVLSEPDGAQGRKRGTPWHAANSTVLRVVKGAPRGTQRTRRFSQKLIPDGAAAGTAVLGVGAGVNGVTAQTQGC
jgi:hypothetical protein